MKPKCIQFCPGKIICFVEYYEANFTIKLDVNLGVIEIFQYGISLTDEHINISFKFYNSRCGFKALIVSYT
jgi:hypothetical protein